MADKPNTTATETIAKARTRKTYEERIAELQQKAEEQRKKKINRLTTLLDERKIFLEKKQAALEVLLQKYEDDKKALEDLQSEDKLF